MDIIEKLRRYTAASAAVPPPEPALSVLELCLRLGGSPLHPESPAVIRFIREYPFAAFLPGPVRAAGKTAGTSICLPVLSRREFAEPLSLSDTLLFDLETTGLAGGTGTYPFLLGFGIFNGQGIEIHQYFLPDYGLENLAFPELIRSFTGKKVLVSFNGKSFDYPLLHNRFILNRLENPFRNCRHLDLLHPARRLWRSMLESCSLDFIENRIFNLARIDDIPGAMIPQAYFEFIRCGNLQDIQRVLEHNRQDILTLGRLLFHLDWLENSADHQELHGQELNNLCNTAIGNFDLERAAGLLDQIRKRGDPPSDLTLTTYSLLLKRSARWEQAESMWLELITSGKNTLFAHEELAKYYEHHKIDLSRARLHTEQALEYIEIMAELSEGDAYQQEQVQFHRRLERLQRKALKRKTYIY